MGDAPREHWEDLADHLGAAYLRYSFTKGTEQEVGFLVRALGLEPGMRVLDVGCGPGRHAHALARRGIEVHGVDISERFVALARAEAPAGATFARLDARALRPGGRLGLSAFSSYFQVQWLDPERGSFDAERGVNHERTIIKDEDGRDAEVDLWTTCFTPRELRLLAGRAGLVVDRLWSVRPGEYGERPPDLEHEELLLVAHRPG